MGLAALFDGILKKELGVHAAWLPVTNTFELGDFGLVSDGVLVKMGNIRSLGLTWTEAPGPDATLDFASEGTRMVRALGAAEVKVLPAQNLDAKLTIEFSRASSFLIKARLALSEMQDLAAVARRLSHVGSWDDRYRVVSRVYTGRNCTVLSSKDAGSKIELTGSAAALKQLDLGAVTAGVEVESSDRIGLQLVGRSGAVGLGLFKLGWWDGKPKLLAGPSSPEGEDGQLTVKTEANWDQLDDDV